MEQQETKLPLEWLSSRRTPELHRLEALCRETAREERCAQRSLQRRGQHPLCRFRHRCRQARGGGEQRHQLL